MNGIRLAVDLDQHCILKTGNRTHVGVKAIPPFQVNKVSAIFGTPDNVQIYR